MITFSYAANTSGIVNKLEQGSGEFWKVTLAKYWSHRIGTVQDLAEHIGKGFSWMPGLLKTGTNRANNNVERLEILGSDIDNGLSIEQALEHEFIKNYCALGIESASSKSEHNKFRLVWILPEAIEPELSRFVYNAIADELGTSDPACKDQARFFFGAKDRKPFLVQGDRTLPLWIIDKARAAQQADIEAQEVIKQRVEQYRSNRADGDLSDKDLAASCLEFIDPSDLDWYEWRNVLLAAHASGLSEYEVRRWSGSCSRHNDKGFNDVWKHIKSTGTGRSLNLGSLIYWAKKNGWEFPKRESSQQNFSDHFISTETEKETKPTFTANDYKLSRWSTASPAIEYEPESRIETWIGLVNSDTKNILVTDPTGTGKSFDAGRLRPEMFEGIERIIYVTTDPRNVKSNNSSFSDWQLLPARHNGIAERDGKLRRASAGEDLTISANCSRTGAIAALRSKNISDEVICKTCPLLNACRHSSGSGYGFKHQRLEAMKRSLWIAHPSALPLFEEFDYSNTLVIWEEAGQSFTTSKQIFVDVSDVDGVIAELSRENIGLLTKLVPITTKLYDLLGNTSKFGLDHLAVKSAIPESVDGDLFKSVLNPDLSMLDTVDSVDHSSAHGKDKILLSRASRLLRAETTLGSGEIETKIQREVLKQWLPEFLDILSGKIVGDLAIAHGKLTITLPDTQSKDITGDSKANIYLDATLSQQILELQLGEKVTHAKAKVEVKMPEIIQVFDIGRLGANRREDGEQSRRLAACIDGLREKHPNLKVIDWKKFNCDGAWMRDSRGSNDFKDTDVLVLNGTPTPNISALRAKYTVLTGLHPEDGDHDFTGFIFDSTFREFTQGIGRKSGERYNQGDRIYIFSNFDFGDLLPITKIKAGEITVEAASKLEKFKAYIAQKIAEAVKNGINLAEMSKRKLAEFLEISRGRFRDNFEWIFLLYRSYSDPIHDPLPEQSQPLALVTDSTGHTEQTQPLHTIDTKQPEQLPVVEAMPVEFVELKADNLEAKTEILNFNHLVNVETQETTQPEIDTPAPNLSIGDTVIVKGLDSAFKYIVKRIDGLRVELKDVLDYYHPITRDASQVMQI